MSYFVIFRYNRNTSDHRETNNDPHSSTQIKLFLIKQLHHSSFQITVWDTNWCLVFISFKYHAY